MRERIIENTIDSINRSRFTVVYHVIKLSVKSENNESHLQKNLKSSYLFITKQMEQFVSCVFSKCQYSSLVNSSFLYFRIFDKSHMFILIWESDLEIATTGIDPPRLCGREMRVFSQSKERRRSAKKGARWEERESNPPRTEPLVNDCPIRSPASLFFFLVLAMVICADAGLCRTAQRSSTYDPPGVPGHSSRSCAATAAETASSAKPVNPPTAKDTQCVCVGFRELGDEEGSQKWLTTIIYVYMYRHFYK